MGVYTGPRKIWEYILGLGEIVVYRGFRRIWELTLGLGEYGNILWV